MVQDKGILYDHLYLISLPAFDIQLKSLNINVAGRQYVVVLVYTLHTKVD